MYENDWELGYSLGNVDSKTKVDLKEGNVKVVLCGKYV